MCLVIFAWLVQQEYFKEMTDQDIRRRIYEEQKNQIEQDMAPFGFILNGVDEEEQVIDQKTGDVWSLNIDGRDNEDSNWKVDEYGDMSHMWEFR